MKLKYIFFLITSQYLLLQSTHEHTGLSIMYERLNSYKSYLEEGTYQGADWSVINPLPKSRYDTFKQAFEHFINCNGKTIVELGTSRSFVHGGCPGCNSSDKKYWNPNKPEDWDWGAGFFTRVASEALNHLNPILHTVDIDAEHINRCLHMTSKYKNNIRYHIQSSLDFLKNCSPESIDLLYIDTGDMTPIEPTAQLQLAEAQIIIEKNLIAPNGIILIDDVRNQTPKKFGDTSGLGKAKYSLPFFLQNGFELIADEYQVLLKKKTSEK